MSESDRSAVPTAHRVAEDRAGLLVFDHAKLAFDIRYHVAEQIFFDVARTGRCGTTTAASRPGRGSDTGGRRRRRTATGRATRSTSRPRPARGRSVAE